MANIEYYTIYRWMREDLHLEDTELHCYAIIHDLSRGDNWYNAGVKNIIDILGKSKPTVISALKELTAKGLIVKVPVVVNNAKRNYYKATKFVDEATLNNLSNPRLNDLTNPRLNNLTNTRLNDLTNHISKYNNKEVKEKRLSNDNQKDDYSADFLEFWGAYAYSRNKRGAYKIWKKLSDKDKKAAFDALPAYAEDCDRCRRSKQYPATYLNKRTWEDDFTGQLKEEEKEEDAPLTKEQMKEWQPRQFWFLRNTPRIAGKICFRDFMKMKELTGSDAMKFKDIILMIEQSDYEGDILPEFSRIYDLMTNGNL